MFLCVPIFAASLFVSIYEVDDWRLPVLEGGFISYMDQTSFFYAYLSAIFRVISDAIRPCFWKLSSFTTNCSSFWVFASGTHPNWKSQFFLLLMRLDGGGHILSELFVLVSGWSADELIFKQICSLKVLIKQLRYQTVFDWFSLVLWVFSLYLVEPSAIAIW